MVNPVRIIFLIGGGGGADDFNCNIPKSIGFLVKMGNMTNIKLLLFDLFYFFFFAIHKIKHIYGCIPLNFNANIETKSVE